ncbi:MAG TPA: type II secretion system F family protein [Acidimicrobiales bacterium]|nr:type II secretion system F family protein [Acidimicrobiales bacterium]
MSGAVRLLPLVVAGATLALLRPAARPPRRPPGVAAPGRRLQCRSAHLRTTVARLRGKLAERTAAARAADDLAEVVDLMAVAAAAGANPRLAVEAAARHHRGEAAVWLAQVLRVVAGGDRLTAALLQASDALPAAPAERLRPLVAVLVDAERFGTPLAPALQRAADDFRVHRQHRAEARARKVPVRLLLPLVLCVLPAFALLTVAPLFAGMARDALADQAIPFTEGPEP